MDKITKSKNNVLELVSVVKSLLGENYNNVEIIKNYVSSTKELKDKLISINKNIKDKISFFEDYYKNTNTLLDTIDNIEDLRKPLNDMKNQVDILKTESNTELNNVIKELEVMSKKPDINCDLSKNFIDCIDKENPGFKDYLINGLNISEDNVKTLHTILVNDHFKGFLDKSLIEYNKNKISPSGGSPPQTPPGSPPQTPPGSPPQTPPGSPPRSRSSTPIRKRQSGGKIKLKKRRTIKKKNKKGKGKKTIKLSLKK